MDLVKNLKNGVKLALELIENNKVKEKFEEYIRDNGDINKLNELKKRYNLK